MSLRNSFIILLIALLATLGFLFWNSASDVSPEPSSNSESTIEDNIIEIIPPSSFPVSEPEANDQPVESFFQSVISIFTPLSSNAPSKTPVISEPYSPEVSEPSIPSSQPTSSNQPDIFSQVWPDYYRDFLSEAQSAMLDQAFITSDQTLTFNSEENIYSFLDNFAYFFKEISGMSDQEFSELQTKLSRIPDFKAQQKQEVLGTLSFQKILKPFINTAQASWVTGGLCYKDNAPSDKSMGYASPIYCCNCGFKITTHGPVFLQDCSINGSACDIHIGCLNGVCKNKANGLWDISTTMCGCG